ENGDQRLLSSDQTRQSLRAAATRCQCEQDFCQADDMLPEPLSAATKMVLLAFIFRKVAWKLSSCRSVLSRVIPASVLTTGTLLMSLAVRATSLAMRVLIGGNPVPPSCSQRTSE